MNRRWIGLASLASVLMLAQLGDGQYRRGGGRGRGRPAMQVPQWENDPEFPHDVFTFVRIRYSSGGGYGRGWERWATDYPDSDLNFSYRLQELTSLQVHREFEVRGEGKVIELTDDALFDYPFIYIVEPGGLYFYEPEVEALRKYLLNGGFLMVDDFWGDDEWYNFYHQIKRVFPNRELKDLEYDHPIFHLVYDLEDMPQIPAINAAWAGQATGQTWERSWDPTTREPHYRAIYDDQDRMMAIICHNTDLGDGWEREGEDEWYFREFSEKKAYPLGINIVVYAMTH